LNDPERRQANATLTHGAGFATMRSIPGETMSVANPTRDDFASLLEETFSAGHSGEGQVVRGTITAIEKDMAIIDVGLKVEGRVPLK
jgi:hypothetical protein